MTAVLLSILWVGCKAQTYSLEQVNDSLSFLTLTTDGHTDRYRLPWPTLRWCTGDVDGDGVEDAMVMVVKRTRFDKRVLPRLFTFTQKNGRVRPLWLGSQLGGILEDFRFVDGQVITLQRTTDYRYVVFRPLDTWEGEDPQLVWMLANPDQMSALVTMCSYRNGRAVNVVAPFGAGCHSLVMAKRQLTEDDPLAVMGMFDVSQRHRLPKDLLSLTFPFAMFKRLDDDMPYGCLTTHAWEQIAQW